MTENVKAQIAEYSIEQVFASGKDMNENIEIKLKEARNV